MNYFISKISPQDLFPTDRKETFKHLIAIKELAEKQNRPSFEDFNDRDMLLYFLYQQTNIDESKNRSSRTVREYERELAMMIRHMFEYGKDMDLDLDIIVEGSLFKNMGKRHVRRYQEWVSKESPHVKKKGSYSAATLARKTVIWKSFFQFLYRSRYIEEPVHEGLLSATVRKDDRPNRDLGPGEVIQLLDFFKKAEHPVLFGMIHTLVATGLRNEEFGTLKVCDVKYDGLLGGFYLDVDGKGNKKRSIPINPKVMDSICNYRKARLLSTDFPNDSSEPLFPTSKGTPFTASYLAQYFGNAIERTNLPFLANRKTRITAHTFRHSFAIISYLEGVDIYKIMRALGHEKIDTTMIYLQKIMERDHHAIHEWKSGQLGEYI
ncbi:tyrosine-type recombinase/integrase [Domibacillus epiphyticus]|uniref:Integrase n=1 Tax=Domibacillus epiphyticus TaxID=1714355 RepID=A0A1V2A433_9BACI|nr:tyrosine-type recombinase/integrase [Domibacillus epiphyticus]OMP65622.1 integrase [Domibacillus epiphyticus]